MTQATRVFETPEQFAAHLRALREKRREQKITVRATGVKRRSLKPIQRDTVLAKTGSRCHICGGKIEGMEWSADHVFAHSQGGQHVLDNYLPAHSLCNNYRWFYGAEEFQWILKLGVWLRTLLEREKPLSMTLSNHFLKYERRRDSRSVNGANGKKPKTTSKVRKK
jgi:5-methylcytosine-specific restriction endonuclease McrA